MQIVTLVVRHACPLSRPMVGTTHGRAIHLFHRGRKVIVELHGRDAKGLDRMVVAYRRIGGEVLHEDENRAIALVRFPTCACCQQGGVIREIEESGYLYLPPCRYLPEGERYQFLVLEPRLTSALLRGLRPGVEVVRVRTVTLNFLEMENNYLVPVAMFSALLTDRQRLAIVTGILRGYYRIPRDVTTEELARELGISRPAYEALLRKAENKVIGPLLPYLVT
ncbi:MAG: helix-turn-helix domain-containing protein [Thermoplasmata archaeon]